AGDEGVMAVEPEVAAAEAAVATEAEQASPPAETVQAEAQPAEALPAGGGETAAVEGPTEEVDKTAATWGVGFDEFEEEEGDEFRKGSDHRDKDRSKRKRRDRALVYDDESGETFVVRKRRRGGARDMWDDYGG
ncbi:MAG: hypothetical protein JXB35_14505, partial [Anaerolineae bacterium]|nr:hypothetical protein [Anaerolineae bacterium]